MIKILAALVVLGMWAGVAGAQETLLSNSAPPLSGGTDNGEYSGHSLFGVVNSDRFHISNEASFSVFSGAGGTLSQGLNVTRLSYNPSSPLTLSVGLGNLFMSSGSYLGYTATPGLFLHDFSLNYNMGGHSLFTIRFEQSPGYRMRTSPNGGFGSTDFTAFPH